jgi:hypothetical protein
MILYEGPLALSPSRLEMFTLLRVTCQGDEDALLLIMLWLHAALFLIMLCARCIIFNNAVCTLHYF